MSCPVRPGSPPLPPANFASRPLRTTTLSVGEILYRIHRADRGPLYFGRAKDPEQRQRWDAPDGGYGVCYLAREESTAFVETLLRDLELDAVPETELAIRSLARVCIRDPIRLAEMHGRALRSHGADASVVQGPYPVTWEWSAAIHAHPEEPDGILCRARHDDSGFTIALFERAADKIELLASTGLLNPARIHDLANWLDRYGVGVTS